jgi:hypothetical protein
MPPGCCKNVVRFCQTEKHRSPVINTITDVKSWIQPPVFLPDYISPLISSQSLETLKVDHSRYKVRYIYSSDLCVLHKVFRI